MNGLIGKKLGMTSVFDSNGKNVACTIIEVGPCVVTQVRTEDRDGYSALQLAYGDRKEKNTPKPLMGHFKAAGLEEPLYKVKEFRDMNISKELGDEVTVAEVFAEGDKVSVVGTSKGKGFQGVVKRHGFGGIMQQTHGQHDRLRAPGSLGNSSFASKVMKGMRMAGQMGNEQVKTRRLKVLKVFPDQNLMLIKGAVPGHKGAYVFIENKSDMKVSVYNIKGEATGRSVELPDEVFGIEPHEHSVWLDVKRYLAAQRQGTHKSKERSEMSGSTRKLHKQKGTGGSRKGDINNPLYRGGGRVFGPRPRNYDIQVNAKVKRLARRSALSAKAKAGSIIVVEDFAFEAPKTSAFLNVLRALSVADKKPLTVTAGYDKMLYLSCRNLEKAKIAPATELNTYQILNAGAVVITESAVEKIKENCA